MLTTFFLFVNTLGQISYNSKKHDTEVPVIRVTIRPIVQQDELRQCDGSYPCTDPRISRVVYSSRFLDEIMTHYIVWSKLVKKKCSLGNKYWDIHKEFSIITSRAAFGRSFWYERHVF